MTPATRARIEKELHSLGFKEVLKGFWRYIPQRRNSKEVCTVKLENLKWRITELCDNGPNLMVGHDIWEATDSLEPYSEESIQELINIVRAIVKDDVK